MVRFSTEKFWLGTIILIGLVVRFFVAKASRLVDDAYITFRYAENLAHGNGFVYNAGEKVLGTTTPLYTIMLVPFAKAGIPLDLAAVGLAIISDLLICLLLFTMFRKHRYAGILAAVFYSFSYVAIVSVGYGMESQVFQLFVVASVAFVSSKRYNAAALAAGLAVLTRPEGVLLAALIGLAILVQVYGRDLFAFIKALLVFVGVAAPWFVFATFYFGSPIPNSILAKISQDEITVTEWLAFFILKNPLIELLWLGALVGLVAGIRKRCQQVILLAVWAVVYTTLFLVGKPPFWGTHYFPPTAMLITVLSAVGVAWVLRGKTRGVVVASILWVAVIVVVLPRSMRTVRWHRTVVENVFQPLGDWILKETAPQDVIQAADIGYLGYISGCRIIDGSALVTPAVWRYHVSHQDDPNWDIAFVIDGMPEYVVLPIRGSVYDRFSRSEFSQRYEPVKRFQVEGASNLQPPIDITDRYARDGRFMADYIIYKKIDRDPAD